MFNLAIEWDMVERNPVKGVKFYNENRRERYLTEEEVVRLLEACTGKLRVIILLALYTGMRKNEILSLRWQRVDLNKGTIVIEGKDSKNKETGHVLLNSVLTEELRSIKLKGSEYVFTGSRGGHLRDIRTIFDAALDKAGIEDFRFHDLRHTFATHLRMNGVDILNIKNLGRWKTLSMVERYAHMNEEHLKESAEGLVEVFSESVQKAYNNEPKKITNLVTH